MQRVVSVVFRKGGKAYYFDPDGLELSSGEPVIVKTARGTEYGEVIAPAQEMLDELIPGQLKKVIRKANEEDLRQVAENKVKEEEAFKAAQEKIAKHKLNMKLVDVEVIFDASKMLFYFTSEDRIDFRDLVRDLASIFKTRIEMRQIGVRDEAKMIGGLGPCGRRLCCTLFSGDFEPVSIRMAKEQNLPLNPMKISGICGRLMCCLRYEYEVYKEFRGRAPKKGTIVKTSLGDGKIVEYNVPRDQVTIALEGGVRKQVPLCEVCAAGGKDEINIPAPGGETLRTILDAAAAEPTPPAPAADKSLQPERQGGEAARKARSGRRRRSRGGRKRPGSKGPETSKQGG